MPPASPATSAKQRFAAASKAVEKSTDHVEKTREGLARAQQQYNDAVEAQTAAVRRRDHALADPDLPEDVRAEAQAEQQPEQPDGPGTPDVGGNTEVDGAGQPLAPVVAADSAGNVVPAQAQPS